MCDAMRCGRRNFLTAKNRFFCFCSIVLSPLTMYEGSFSSHHFLLQALDVGFHVKSKARPEDEWKHNVTITIGNRCLIFINISTDWHSNTLKSSHWNSCVNAKQYTIFFFESLEEWIASWYIFPRKQCLTGYNLLHSRQIERMCEMNDLKYNNLPHAFCAGRYVCMYLPLRRSRKRHKVHF